VRDVVTAAESLHACAVMNDGTARCWGSNRDGQLGDGSTLNAPMPPVVVRTASGSPMIGVASLATGQTHTCALLEAGTVSCWGDNERGQLGDGTTDPSMVPIAVMTADGAPLAAIAAIAAGDDFTCALTQLGGVLCWGDNEFGQLGNSHTWLTMPAPRFPVEVVDAAGAPLTGATAISVGYKHACAVLSGGTVGCWGHNLYGQLGNNSTIPASVPAVVSSASGEPLSGMVGVSAGIFVTCAVAATGGASCWGLNNFESPGDHYRGLLGNNDGSTEFSMVPVTVVADDTGAALEGVRQIGVGQVSTCARMRDGSLRCWGDGAARDLSTDKLTFSAVPVPVFSDSGVPLTGASRVSDGAGFTCALLQPGAVVCWGDDAYGQLGDGGAVGASVVPLSVQLL
jgi:alpha-tubulin suppressor-like RCC1 family protein